MSHDYCQLVIGPTTMSRARFTSIGALLALRMQQRCVPTFNTVASHFVDVLCYEIRKTASI